MQMNKELLHMLSQPFPSTTIQWKAQATTKDKASALAVPYISASDVMDRLDAVVGPENWSQDFEVLPDGSVKLTLTICGISKANCGSIAGKDTRAAKGSVSDGLKRAAVLFSIGRYIQNIPVQWVAYDAQRKQLKETPAIPASLQPPPATEQQLTQVRELCDKLNITDDDKKLLFRQATLHELTPSITWLDIRIFIRFIQLRKEREP